MKTIFYDNKIMKIISPFIGDHTISIGPFIFSSLKEYELSSNQLNHYKVHNRQWSELTILSLILITITGNLYDLGNIIGCMLTYYVLYLIELLVRLSLSYFIKFPINNVSFEQEAESAEEDITYFDKFKIFSWIKYLWR